MEYYITSSVFESEIQEFDNDIDAWNSLRLLIPNRFATLMKNEEHRCKLLNPKQYLDAYYSKYNVLPYNLNFDDIENINEDSFEITYHKFVPVLEGMTSDKY